mmetsp:Transcript_12911/g.16989  ORF Transcript_12911/g.16989 Transcript_12911/m.16989 type:complete len:208 (-) Transcript_12911:303-926(-)
MIINLKWPVLFNILIDINDGRNCMGVHSIAMAHKPSIIGVDTNAIACSSLKLINTRPLSKNWLQPIENAWLQSSRLWKMDHVARGLKVVCVCVRICPLLLCLSLLVSMIELHDNFPNIIWDTGFGIPNLCKMRHYVGMLSVVSDPPLVTGVLHAPYHVPISMGFFLTIEFVGLPVKLALLVYVFLEWQNLFHTFSHHHVAVNLFISF